MGNDNRYSNYTFDKIISLYATGAVVPNLPIKYNDDSAKERELPLYTLVKAKNSLLYMDNYLNEYNAPLWSLINDVYGTVKKIELGHLVFNDDLQQLLDIWIEIFPNEPVPKTVDEFREELKPVYFAATMSIKEFYITTPIRVTRHEECYIGWANPKWKGYWMIPWVKLLAYRELHNVAIIFAQDKD